MDRKNKVCCYLVNDRQTVILSHLLQYSCSKISENMSRERERMSVRGRLDEGGSLPGMRY